MIGQEGVIKSIFHLNLIKKLIAGQIEYWAK
jgi:hypothetical protein